MNTSAIKQEITNLLSNVRQPSRKQYPVAKHQINSLTELGIIDLMPSGYGYTDAAVVIEAAQDAGGDPVGEGQDVLFTDPSVLYQLLNETDEPEADDDQTDLVQQEIKMNNTQFPVSHRDLRKHQESAKPQLVLNAVALVLVQDPDGNQSLTYCDDLGQLLENIDQHGGEIIAIEEIDSFIDVYKVEPEYKFIGEWIEFMRDHIIKKYTTGAYSRDVICRAIDNEKSVRVKNWYAKGDSREALQQQLAAQIERIKSNPNAWS